MTPAQRPDYFHLPTLVFALALALAIALPGLRAQDAGASIAQPPGLFPFVMAWDDANATVTAADDTTLPRVTDLSNWLEKPAGARGFVSVDGAHFYTGGKRMRLLGVNLSFAANFPYHPDAEKLAARLARFGINSVRFHHMDVSLFETMSDGRRRSIWNNDLKTISPDQLDRLDYLFAQLKARGIYGNLNLHVSRTYPGFPKGKANYHKGIDIFFPPMIEMQKQYARQLLHHTNPYTGLRYVDDPALAIVEINNENSLLGFWWRGTMDDLDPLFANELRARWNKWLRQRHTSTAKAAQTWRSDTPSGSQPGPELVKNPKFTDPASPARHWTLQNLNTPEPILTLAPPPPPPPGANPPPGIALNLQPESAPGKASAVFFQTGFSLVPGKRYTLKIKISATTPQPLNLGIMDSGQPYRTHFSTRIDVPTTPSVFETSFVHKESAPASNLRLNLRGFTPGTNQFRIEEISLREGGATAELQQTADGEIEYPLRNNFGNYAGMLRNDWLHFLYETELAYWNEMRDFLRNDLQVRIPIIGSQLGNYSNFAIQRDMDAIDFHAYWQHPNYAAGNTSQWTVTNTSMVGDATGAYAAIPSLYRIAGRPYVLTEYNHCAPNTYAAETFPIISAYGAFQDWTGIFAYSWAHGFAAWDSALQSGNFDIDQHPLKLATLPIAAALFLRGDANAPATITTQIVPISTPSLFKKMDQVGADISAETVGGSRHDALRRPYAITLDDRAPDAPPPLPRPTYAGPITSEGGALTWDAAPDAGIFTLRTARTKAAIGFARGRTFDLDGLSITPGPTLQDWSTIALSQIQGTAIGAPGRALLVACGYMENTGQVWKTAAKDSVNSWGQAPTLVEGVPARITLQLAPTASDIKVWALDQHGRRAQPVPVARSGSSAKFNIGPEYKTIWYEIQTR